MNLLAIALVLILMSIAPSIAFFIGVLLIGVHIGTTRRVPRASYTKRQDAGTLEQTIRYIEENRHDRQ